MTLTAITTIPANRIEQILGIYLRVMSGALLLLGLRQWAIIVGLTEGAAGPFEDMSTPWQLATMHLAVADLVAAVGLWQRVAWGNVLWIYAALAEIAMHTVFVGTYGYDFPIVAFHVLAIAIFAVLAFLARRASHSEHSDDSHASGR